MHGLVLAAILPFLLDDATIAPKSFEPAFFAAASDGQTTYVVSEQLLSRIDDEGNLLDPVARKLDFVEPEHWVQGLAAGHGILVSSNGGPWSPTAEVNGFTTEGELLWQRDIRADKLVFDGNHFITAQLTQDSIFVQFLDANGTTTRSARLQPDGGWRISTSSSVKMVATRDGAILSWAETHYSPGNPSADGRRAVVQKITSSGGTYRRDIDIGLGHLIGIAPSDRETMLLIWLWNGHRYIGNAMTVGDELQDVTPMRMLDIYAPAPIGGDAVWDGTRYRVSWTEYGNNITRLFLVDLDRTLRRLGPPAVAEQGASSSRFIVTGEHTFLFMTRSTFIRAKRVATSAPASELQTAPLLHVFGAIAEERHPAVIWTGDRYLALWLRSGEPWELRMRTFDAAGRPLTPATTIVPIIGNWRLSLAANRNGVMAAFGRSFLTFTTSGAFLRRTDPFLRTDVEDIATDGSSFLWIGRYGNKEIMAGVVYPSGGSAGPGHTIFTYADALLPRRLSLIFNGQRYQTTYGLIRPGGGAHPVLATLDAEGKTVWTERAETGRDAQPDELLGSDGRHTILASSTAAALVWGSYRSHPNVLFDRDREEVAEDVVWTGSSWLVVTDTHRAIMADSELENVRELQFGTTAPLGSAVATDGAGRAMLLWIDPHGPSNRLHGVMIGYERRRSVGHSGGTF